MTFSIVLTAPCNKDGSRKSLMGGGGAIPYRGPIDGDLTSPKSFKPGFRKLGFRPLYLEAPYHVFFFAKIKIIKMEKVAQGRGLVSPFFNCVDIIILFSACRNGSAVSGH